MLVRFSSSTVIDCLIRWNEANKLVTRTNCWFANEFSQKFWAKKTVFNGSKGKNSYFLSAERPLDGRHRWSGWMVDAWVSLHRTLLGTSINKVETILKRQYTHTVQYNGMWACLCLSAGEGRPCCTQQNITENVFDSNVSISLHRYLNKKAGN